MFSRLYTQLVAGALLVALLSMLVGLLLGGGPRALTYFSNWITLAVVVVVVGVVAHLFALRTTMTLRNLQRSMESLTKDDHHQRVANSGPDELISLSATIHDAAISITEDRKRSRDAIERLSTILESMADGVLAVDHRYHVLLANAACYRMLEIPPKGVVVGRPLLEITRSRALYDAVGQALARPGSLTLELDAGQQNLLLRAAQLPGEPIPGVVVVLHDVTEVRRLENIRKELVANVSHELKTPLASIKAYAETLQLGAINDVENNVQFVSRIEEDADRLHGLITDMLQIARIESHQQAFRIRPVEIGKQVSKCVRDMQARADSKNIELRVVAPEGAVSVNADDEGVQTILANLVDNAIKYTPAGGQVSIAWRADGDSLMLTVEDTGMGIEANLQDRIFERFFRVDRARTRDSGGTGLGLSIVKHLVQAFDGTVQVRSTLGEGSCFFVRLPLTDGKKVGA